MLPTAISRSSRKSSSIAPPAASEAARATAPATFARAAARSRWTSAQSAGFAPIHHHPASQGRAHHALRQDVGLEAGRRERRVDRGGELAIRGRTEATDCHVDIGALMEAAFGHRAEDDEAGGPPP